MLCDVFIGRGATLQCICVVYCFWCVLIFQFLGNTQFCASIQQDQLFCLNICIKMYAFTIVELKVRIRFSLLSVHNIILDIPVSIFSAVNIKNKVPNCFPLLLHVGTLPEYGHKCR